MRTKLIREGDYLAEVDVELLHEDEAGGPGWGPYLQNDDVMKLDRVRRALRDGDLQQAVKYGGVFRLIPVPAA